jgi:hypothetical protein
MSRPRKAKKADRARRGSDRLALRRRRLQALLRDLGFEQANTALLDELLRRRYPVPNVVLSPAAAERSNGPALCEAVRAAFSQASVAVGPQGAELSLPEFFADYLSVVDACEGELVTPGGVSPGWTEFARDIVPQRKANTKRALRALTYKIDEALLPHCSYAEAIYFARYSYEASPERHRKPQLTVTVDVHRAIPVSFELDGKPRPAWRCGLPFRTDGIEWVRWTRATPGFGDERPDADVYLQSHAIRRLEERVCFPPSDLTDWIWQSLRKPVLRPQRSGWLVEFRVWQWHLGYFCAEETDRGMVLTTFLFLTNAGTPEGNHLRERLRLATDDVAWLKMDNLEYFIQSDVQNDEELLALFDECGCGHLFEMMKPEARTATLERARATRRHLQMPSST